MNPRNKVHSSRNGEELLQAQLEAVADSSDTGVVLFDSAGRVQLTNRRFAEMAGLEREETVGCTSWEELAQKMAGHMDAPEDFIERWRTRMQRCGEASWDEIRIDHPAPHRIERFGRPVRNAAGDPIGRIENYREVPHESQTETRGLQTEKLAGLGQLVSGIAHELNNPLTSITGYAQLLISRPLPAPQSADAQRIFQEAERASHIVKNLLLFARERRPEKRAVDLNEVIDRTLALRNYELRVENIAVEANLDRDLPLVLADPVQIQQVLLNLIINAEQSIEQSGKEGIIRIRDFRAGNRVQLEISDSGSGIPQENIGRIFDPFFTTKPAGVGTGLGLSLAQQILREHGGQICVESAVGQGAKFTIELAVSGQQKIERLFPAREPARVRILPRGRQPRRVLVIEDEPTVANLIEDVLAEEGYTAETHLDGREGLERALQEDYDLVICDLKMPHVDGRMIYHELVSHHSPLQNRLVFVTGDVLASRTMEFLESTGLPYLAKPFQVDDLKAVVARAFSEATTAGPAMHIRGAAHS